MGENDMNECYYNLEKVLELFKHNDLVRVTLKAGTVIENLECGVYALREPGTKLNLDARVHGGTYTEEGFVPGYLCLDEKVYDEDYNRYLLLEVGDPISLRTYRIEYGSVANVEGLYTTEEGYKLDKALFEGNIEW